MKKPRLIAVGGKTMPKDKSTEEFYNEIQTDVLARTIWGEARGEGTDGMDAIACVILNRVKVAEDHGGKFWWGSNIVQVCQKPYQFSCWNRSDPNFQKLQDVDSKDLYFATAVRIAVRAVAGILKDSTNGATHYHAKSVDPYWARDEKPTATIGNHIFYRLVES